MVREVFDDEINFENLKKVGKKNHEGVRISKNFFDKN
jgi:hypothetical protein